MSAINFTTKIEKCAAEAAIIARQRQTIGRVIHVVRNLRRRDRRRLIDRRLCYTQDMPLKCRQAGGGGDALVRGEVQLLT